MFPSPLRYRIPSRVPTRALMECLREHWDLDLEPIVSAHRTYLDTADWRVLAAGSTLEVERAAEAPRLILRDHATAAVNASVDGCDPPGFASELPPGPVWEEVGAGLESRRLMPQLEADLRSQRINLRNADGKITVRVDITRYLVGDASAGRHQIRLATVLPVRGYQSTATRAAKALADAGLHPEPDPLLVVGLDALRRPRPGAKLGPGVPLERTTPGSAAVGSILGRLLDHLVSNEEGSRQQLDIEFLHEFRVAIRRARSIVKQVGEVLPAAPTRALAAELGWLGSVTGPVRDLDVHLLDLGPDPGPNLAPLGEYLVSCRKAAQKDLISAIDSPRYQQLRRDWAELAGTTRGLAGTGGARAAGAVTAGELADARIARANRRVLRRGRVIVDETPAEALHDLRKRAKELRYLLECFQMLYPEEERTPFIRELKALQDNLGEFQDCQVQAATLRAMAEELFDERVAPVATLMAMGSLADGLEGREARARAEFADRFARFSSEANQARLAQLVSGFPTP